MTTLDCLFAVIVLVSVLALIFVQDTTDYRTVIREYLEKRRADKAQKKKKKD